jgi:prepilin-type N-terminal cleavage/methylation domain-containing protein
MTRFLSRSSGFTLVELAMVLFIVSLLIGGLLMPLTAQNEIRGRQETDRALANIRDALIGFAAVNGRLPCPADRTIASGVANAGVEAVTVAGGPCACTDNAAGIAAIGAVACDHDDNGAPSGVTGVVPWATLGLSEADAWGNRYTYRVTTRFARLASLQTIFGGACAPTSNPAAAAFALCSVGDMSVKTAVGGTDIATAVPVIVVSHGRNTLGAYMTSGAQVAGVVAGSDEAENANGDVNFVSNSVIDDQLIWLPTSILMGRMLSAGKLP